MASGADYQQRLDDEPDLMNYNDPRSTLDYCWGNRPKCKKCIWCSCLTILILLAVQLTFLPHLIRHMVHKGIQDALIITSTSSSGYDGWQANTGSDAVPVWMECRFFNVTNVYEIITYGDTPQIEITPPMVYNEISIKYNVSFSKDKDWAMYNTWEYYTYNEKRSHLDPNANLTIFSPLIGALWYAEEWGTSFKEREEIKELSKILQYINVSDILFWRGTAKDLLFDIYHIDILNTTIEIPFGLLGNGSNINSTDGGNGTFEIINTGNSDNKRLGELLYYGKFGEYVQCWDLPYSLSPGHDTYFGINNINQNDNIFAFVSTLYLNVIAEFNHSYTWNGIELWRYTVQSSPQFDNITNYPPNKQFYQITYNGLENITKCSGGMPLFVSFPYFLAGDERLINNSIKMGMPKPTWNIIPYIDLEPKTGAIFRANKSLQINTMIHSIDWVPNTTEYSNGYYNIPDDFVIPMVELSECESLTNSQANTFKSEIINTETYANILEYVGYVACALLVTFWLSTSFVYGGSVAKKQQKEKKLNA